MSEISTNTVFVSLIIAVVLLFVGTLCSAITASLMFGFNNWLKVSTKDVRTLEHKAADIDLKVEKIAQRVVRIGERTNKLWENDNNLLSMMSDASNMELSPEEISSRIRARLEKMGFKYTEGQ